MPSHSVSAAQVQAEFLRHIAYSPSGYAGIMHAYSDGTSVTFTNPDEIPSNARWVAIAPFSSQLNEGVEIYFSRDGITTEKQFIKLNGWSDFPADAKWLTISNFDGGFGEGNPIRNQEYAYSVDGLTVQRGSEVPAHALWATLSSYQVEWGGELKTLDYSRSYSGFTLDVDSIQTVSIGSDAPNSSYAKAGDEVTLSFTSLFPLQEANVTIGGQQAVVAPDVARKDWKASVIVSSVQSEGEIPFSIVYRDPIGASEGTVSVTTDGSSVIFDQTPPTVTLTPSTTDWTKDDVVVTGYAVDLGSGIAIQKWAEGKRDIAYFENSGHNVLGNTFSASKNQSYTWYAKDRAGNETVQTIEISMIDQVAPTLTVDYDPKEWTSDAVQISAVATDDLSGIKVIKWASDARDEAFFQNGEGTEFSDSYPVAANGTYTVYAEDRAGNGIVEQRTISNLDTTPPIITLTPSTTVATKEDITVIVDISDLESGVSLSKWAAGKQDVSYFLYEGTSLEGETFLVSEIGTYTVYAKDQAGNECVETIEISNIFKTSSRVSLSLATNTWTNKPIRVQTDIMDNGSGIAERKWAKGQQEVPYFKKAGTPFDDTEFAVIENGWYTVYIKDNAGYEALASIKVSNFDDEKPIIHEPILFPNTWTNRSVTVSLSAQDNSGEISLSKWSTGEQDEALFQNGGGTDFSDSFTVDENGVYTIYVQDASGNGAVRSFHVSTIDKDVPEISLYLSTELPTNQNVTVTADVLDASPIVKQKWALGEQPLSYFSTEGIDFVDRFEAELNGLYTVYAEDAAGNKQIETVEITNIFKEVPVIQLVVSPTVPTQERITVTASVDSQLPIVERKLAFGQQDVSYFQTEGEPWSDLLEVLENGWVSYYVQDHAGNETVKQIEITNIDREKPMITLNGQEKMSIAIRSAFTDPGATALDNLDGDLTENIVVSGQVNTQVAGEYTLRYNVTDTAGNSAEEVIRLVTVIPRSSGGGGGGNSNPGQGGGNPSPGDKEDPDVPVDPNDPEEPLDPDSGESCSPPTPFGNGGDLPTFSDIESHWASEAICQLAADGIVKGYPDGTFKPQRNVTRAEFATLLVNSLGLDKQQESTFLDTREHWARDSIAAAKKHGIIDGYSNVSFGPDDPLTREQMAMMLVNAYSLSAKKEDGLISFHDRNTIAGWAQDAVQIVADNQIMVGFPGDYFRPKAFSTRAETAVVLHRMQLLMNELTE